MIQGIDDMSKNGKSREEETPSGGGVAAGAKAETEETEPLVPVSAVAASPAKVLYCYHMRDHNERSLDEIRLQAQTYRKWR